ncbi:MAG: hypothetical protein AAGE65_03565 [Planctomycetota bacterium]
MTQGPNEVIASRETRGASNEPKREPAMAWIGFMVGALLLILAVLNGSDGIAVGILGASLFLGGVIRVSAARIQRTIWETRGDGESAG